MCDELDATFSKRRNARRAFPSKGFKEVKTFFDLYEPEAVCVFDERFGQGVNLTRYQAFGDGPKFLCGVDMIATKNSNQIGNNRCLVYSVGSSNQIHFESSVHQQLGCEIHTFDPTLTEAFVGDKYATFHPWGLGEDGAISNFGGKSFTAMSLQTIIKRLGHEGRTIDILKIDCEGCEWIVMPKVFESIRNGTNKINQVLIELHPGRIKDMQPAAAIKDFFWNADAAQMRTFHKERNHWGCNGYLCVEYSFVDESFLREVNGQLCS